MVVSVKVQSSLLVIISSQVQVDVVAVVEQFYCYLLELIFRLFSCCFC